jgi:hypothetical protein
VLDPRGQLYLVQAMTKIIAVLIVLGQFEVAVETSKGYFVESYPDTEIGVTEFLHGIRQALDNGARALLSVCRLRRTGSGTSAESAGGKDRGRREPANWPEGPGDRGRALDRSRRPNQDLSR